MEVAPQPPPEGYVHGDVQLATAMRIQLEALGQEPPMRRREYQDQCARNVNVDHEVVTEVYPEAAGDHTVTMVLDARTAAIVHYAVRLMAANYDSHAREVRQVAAQMPPGSYGLQNRLAIADQHERIAKRLRTVERAYQEAVDRDYWGI